MTSFDGRGLSEEQLTEKFHEIAKSAIHGGYFLVDGSVKIRIIEVEFYFHSENPVETQVYDWGMYHIGKNIDYFKLGSLHPHNSGVDVTFERAGSYRASFLIRKYQIDTDTEILGKPTYLREDLFGYTGCICGDGPNIVWVDEIPEYNIAELKQSPRINLTAYNDDGTIKKDASGKKLKDSRKWRFTHQM